MLSVRRAIVPFLCASAPPIASTLRDSLGRILLGFNDRIAKNRHWRYFFLGGLDFAKLTNGSRWCVQCLLGLMRIPHQFGTRLSSKNIMKRRQLDLQARRFAISEGACCSLR